MSDEELRQAIYELEDTTMLRLGQMSREELEKEYDGIEVDMDEQIKSASICKYNEEMV